MTSVQFIQVICVRTRFLLFLAIVVVWHRSYIGSDAVQARTIANLDDDILEEYGGGDYWIVGAAWEKGERCANNNYLESSKIDVGHGVCGDPPQVSQRRGLLD